MRHAPFVCFVFFVVKPLARGSAYRLNLKCCIENGDKITLESSIVF